MRARVSAIAMAVVLVAMAVVVGVVIERRWLATQNDGQFSTFKMRGLRVDELVTQLNKRLDLTPEQSDEIRKVLNSAREDVLDLRSRLRPELEATWTRSRTSIHAILGPEQAGEYDRLIERDFSHPGVKGMRNPADTFKSLDLNSDNTVSREECEKSDVRPSRRVLDRFEEIDTDSDGLLTLREFMDGLPMGRRGP